MPSHNTAIVVKTIAITASITIVLAATFFFLCYKCFASRRRIKNDNISKRSFRREDVTTITSSCKIHSNHDSDGFSLRKLEEAHMNNNNNNKNNFPEFVFNPSYKGDGEEEKRALDSAGNETSNGNSKKPKSIQMVESQLKPQEAITQASFGFKPPLAPKKSTHLSSNVSSSEYHQTNTALTPQPPPPPPPLPPPLPALSIPKSSGWIRSRRMSSVAPKRRVADRNNESDSLSKESSNGNNVVTQMKLKPLHWDKVTADVDHSTVWDEISHGSLRFDDELMENLFGYSTKNRQSSERANIFSSGSNRTSSPPTQIFLLDPRKSQNTAIVLRSLAISRREILEALTEGHDLGSEALEKLTKISLTKEEVAKILRFDGNPGKLADAESFLFQILRAVPSAFPRFEAMLFRSNYGPEISSFRESLETLESACRELRSRGPFFKLLEAVLRAGNKMNEGTPRGGARGFDLEALKKLSGVRSSDGETTLLRFLVEQVARSEGTKKKKCLNQLDGDKDHYLVLQGLASLEGMSTKELSNVKKAAAIEHGDLAILCERLGSQVTEIRMSFSGGGGGEEEREWFSREMRGFLEACEEEIEVLREEKKRVMGVVDKTVEYYRAGGSNLRDKKPSDSNPFQLFVIVKDFIDVVDQVCVETSKKLRQKRNNNNNNNNNKGNYTVVGSPETVTLRRFSNFHVNLMSEMSLTSSESESEDEFLK